MYHMKKLNPTYSEIIFAANLKHLTDNYVGKAYLSAKSGVSSRMIDFLIKLERGASVDTADRIGKAVGVPAWLLLIEHLTIEMVRNKELCEIVENFTLANDEGKLHILEASRKEAFKKPLSTPAGGLKHIKEGEHHDRRRKIVRDHQLPRKKKAK